MTDKQYVECYGIHWEGQVAWLCQGRSGTNFVGLRNHCPFQVQAGMCNHLVPTAAPIPDRHHWAFFQKISEDPLVKAMLPLPKSSGKNLFFLEDPHDDYGLYLTNLSRFSSPIKPIVKPIWTFDNKLIEKELGMSNIQPLVLVQADQKSQTLIDRITKLGAYCPRTIIISGRSDLVVRPPFQRVTSSLRDFDLGDMMSLPLESLGAMILRRFARKEDVAGPIETREERRKRQIQERSRK